MGRRQSRRTPVGNQTVIAGGIALAYDVENRQTSNTVSGLRRELYAYDGEGRRVQHVHQVYSGGSYNTTATTVYVYDAKGRLAAEYGAQSSSASCGTCYLTTDALGSSRLMTDSSGAVVARYDYLPFGQEIFASGPTGRGGVLCGSVSCYATGSESAYAVNQKFTGKERDAETGLDYFGARYLSSAQARFTIPDWSEQPQPVPYADYRFPQSLNLYSYLKNNTLNSRDQDGHCELTCWTLIGAAIGATVNVGLELYSAHVENRSVTLRDIVGASTKGAVVGAASVLTAGSGFVGAIAGVAGANVSGGIADRAIRGESALSPKEIGKDALSGAIGGAIGVKAEALGKLVVEGSAEVAASKGGDAAASALFSNAKTVVAGEKVVGAAAEFVQGAVETHLENFHPNTRPEPPSCDKRCRDEK
jgi:RHS repeat-associated protein